MVNDDRKTLIRELDEIVLSFPKNYRSKSNVAEAYSDMSIIPALYEVGDYEGLVKNMAQVRTLLSSPPLGVVDSSEGVIRISTRGVKLEKAREVYNNLASKLNLDPSIVQSVGEIKGI